MPSRHILRMDLEHAYYHVYNRGSSKQVIYIDNADYVYFIRLLERYLSPDMAVGKDGTVYPDFNDKIELLAYCLMPNHYHLLFYQVKQRAVSQCMKSINTSYTRYFNLKYKRSGPIFESRFKASLVNNDAYLTHISRYIHLNPRSWKRYPYSSINSYLKAKEPSWLHTKKVLEEHGHDRLEYLAFMQDYQDYKVRLDELKYELADQ